MSASQPNIIPVATPEVPIFEKPKNDVEIVKVGDDTIVLETHVRTDDLPQEQSQFDELLDSASLVVVEARGPEDHLYEKLSKHPRFMRQGIAFAENHDIPLIVMDEIYRHAEMWEEVLSKFGYSNDYFWYGHAMLIASLEHDLGGKPESEIFLDVFDSTIGLPDSLAGTILSGALMGLKDLNHYPEIAKDVVDLIVVFLNVGSIIRDRHYEEIIRDQKSKAQGNVVVIVGHDHKIAAKRGLGDMNESGREVDSDEIKRLIQIIDRLREFQG